VSYDKDFYLIQGDCIEEMRKLIDNDTKVDLILTDPPYGTTDCRWDNIIPFKEMWDCIDKLTYDYSPVLLFGSEPFTTNLQYSNIENFKYTLYWIKNKNSGFLHANNKPLVNVECVSVFSKGDVNHEIHTDKRMTYNPQGLKKTYKKVKNNKKYDGGGKQVYSASSFATDEYVQEYTNYPTMTINFDVVKNKNKKHPTEKPVELLEYLINTYSNPDSTVLDFTMGSGSTGVACRNTKRKFIGIELEKEYYDTACDRVNNYQSKLI
jgi:site-specific DNA-methyltransferase (adenine-specific)